MCHVGQKGLDKLIEQEAIKGSNLSELKTCKHCILGKSKKAPYRRAILKPRPLLNMHTQNCGVPPELSPYEEENISYL